MKLTSKSLNAKRTRESGLIFFFECYSSSPPFLNSFFFQKDFRLLKHPFESEPNNTVEERFCWNDHQEWEGCDRNRNKTNPCRVRLKENFLTKQTNVKNKKHTRTHTDMSNACNLHRCAAATAAKRTSRSQSKTHSTNKIIISMHRFETSQNWHTHVRRWKSEQSDFPLFGAREHNFER